MWFDTREREVFIGMCALLLIFNFSMN